MPGGERARTSLGLLPKMPNGSSEGTSPGRKRPSIVLWPDSAQWGDGRTPNARAQAGLEPATLALGSCAMCESERKRIVTLALNHAVSRRLGSACSAWLRQRF